MMNLCQNWRWSFCCDCCMYSKSLLLHEVAFLAASISLSCSSLTSMSDCPPAEWWLLALDCNKSSTILILASRVWLTTLSLAALFLRLVLLSALRSCPHDHHLMMMIWTTHFWHAAQTFFNPCDLSKTRRFRNGRQTNGLRFCFAPKQLFLRLPVQRAFLSPPPKKASYSPPLPPLPPHAQTASFPPPLPLLSSSFSFAPAPPPQSSNIVHFPLPSARVPGHIPEMTPRTKKSEGNPLWALPRIWGAFAPKIAPDSGERTFNSFLTPLG